jgi:hypothetical protein
MIAPAGWPGLCDPERSLWPAERGWLRQSRVSTAVCLLAATYRDGVARPVVKPTKAEIYKDGAFVCGFRFVSPSGSVEMEVPRTKSWVEVRWNPADPEDQITGLSADINLAVEPPRTLVDFGAAATFTLLARRGREAARCGWRWRIDAGGQPMPSGRRPHGRMGSRDGCDTCNSRSRREFGRARPTTRFWFNRTETLDPAEWPHRSRKSHFCSTLSQCRSR